MKEIIASIRPQKNKYGLSHVDCFESTIAQLLGNYGQYYANVFIMSSKLYRCYYRVTYPDMGNLSDQELFKEIIETHLNLNINDTVENSIHETIKKHIALREPIIVPINLKEIYYSSNYMETNWPHLIIIKGYDDEKKIYSIISSLHTKEGRYEDFYMEYQTLEKAFEASEGLFDSKFILSFTKRTDTFDVINVLKNLINILLNDVDSTKYIEIDCIDDIMTLIKEKKEEESIEANTKLKRIINFKEVLYSELANILNVFIDNKKLMDKYMITTLDLINKWNDICNICAVNCYRGKMFDVSKKKEEAIQVERDIKEVLTEVKDALESLKKSKYNNEKIMTEKWKMENNSDFIITEKEGNIVFNMPEDRFYDMSSLGDDSPKALLFNNIEPSTNYFEFKTLMSIKKYGQEIEFHSGIFLRTTSGDAYIWGKYCGESIVLIKFNNNPEHIKKDLKIVQYDLEDDMANEFILLKVRKQNDSYFFEYAYEDEKTIKSYRVDNISGAFQIGLVCRTWSVPKKLTVEYTQNALHNDLPRLEDKYVL